jgi:tripartite-type tricarboxylate transporter receptor subunit TctC
MKYIILFLFCLVAHAQPVKQPIRVVMHGSPGGGPTITFNQLKQFAETKNITLIPIYKPGAEGILAMEYILDNPVNTIGLMGLSNILPEHLNKINIITKIKIQPQSFVYINMPNMNLPITIGSQSMSSKIAALQLPIKHILINYKSAQQSILDVLGQHINMAVIPFSVTKPYIDNNKLKLYMLTSKSKFPEYNTNYAYDLYPNWKSYEGHVVFTVKQYHININNLFKDYLNDSNTKKQYNLEYRELPIYGDINNIPQLIRESQQYR